MRKKHYDHNFYMAEIGQCITNNKIPLSVDTANQMINGKYAEGVKEILGFYLLITYLNNENNRLKYDGTHEQITIYNDEYVAFSSADGHEIKIKQLRDTICHSFVSCDVTDDIYIIFDDRVVLDRKTHEGLAGTEKGEGCVKVRLDDVMSFLKKAFDDILLLND